MTKIFLILIFILTGCSSNNTKTSYFPKGVKEKASLFRVVWNKNLDPEYMTGNLPIALSSPLAKDGLLFLGDNRGNMSAYDFGNGREVWRFDEKGIFHSAPIIYKDMVIYGTTQGRLIARNHITGKTVYSIDLGASIESDLVVSQGRLFLQLRNHQIFSLDVATGKVLWAYKRSVPFLTTLQRASNPLVINSKLFIGFADGHVAAFSVEDGMLLWEKKLSSGNKFVDVDLSPVYHKGNILVGSLAGPLMVLSPDTGNIIRTFEFTASRSPLIYDDKLIVGTVSGEVVVIDSSYQIVKELKLSNKGISSIVNWKGYLTISTVGGEIILLDAKNYSEKERLNLGHSSSAVFGKLVVEENKLALFSSRNRLYVFE